MRMWGRSHESPRLPAGARVEPGVGRRRRRRRGEWGQSLVEFALVLPLFLVLLLGTIDFGWALRAYITATNAAREGARLGVTGASAADITLRTEERANGLSPLTITVDGAAGQSGSSVTVRVTYDYDYITPIGGLLSGLSMGTLPDPLPMSTKTTMRLE